MRPLPDLNDPRYLDEIGWFLYHQKHERHQFGGSYDEERLASSEMLLDEVLGFIGEDRDWLSDKTVVSVGSGCTGDLSMWPAAVKIAVDPLLYAYQKLGMLIDDVAGTNRTVAISVGAQDLPLVDDMADLVICRNALDHMHDPEAGLKEMARILKGPGLLFVDVDFGGVPTPDEPTVFTPTSLSAVLAKDFTIETQLDGGRPNVEHRSSSSRILLRRRPDWVPSSLDKDAILGAYMSRVESDL